MAGSAASDHEYDNDGALILTGSANAYVASTARKIKGYYAGFRCCGRIPATSTGASTITVDEAGTIAIRKAGNAALGAGDVVAGTYYDFIYDDANNVMQVESLAIATPVSVANGGTGASTAAGARANLGAVNKAGDTMTGSLAIVAGNATSAIDFFVVQPSDFGADKPQFSLYKGATANQWNLALFDGTDNGGDINFISGTLSFNGASIVPKWQMVTKTTDENRNTTTTFADDGALVFAMAANTNYMFRGEGFYDTPAAADFKYQLNGPASPTLVRIDRYGIDPDGSFSNPGTDEAYAQSTAQTSGASTFGWFKFSGIVRNGANAGNFALQWAQNTSNGSNTTMRAGSYIEYRVVA